MAVPTDILSLYDVGGATLSGSGPLREQLLPTIYNVDPDEVPVTAMLPSMPVSGPLVQWLKDSLPSHSNIALGEAGGDAAPVGGAYKTNTNPSRLSNRIMALRADLSVEDDVLEADQAGYENALLYHIGQWSAAWHIKRELILLDPEVAEVTGNESTARVLKNFPAFLSDASTTTTMGAGTSVRSIDEGLFNDGLQEYWQNGGKGRAVIVDMDTMRQIQSSFFGLAKTVSAATTDANTNRRVVQAGGSIEGNVEFYRGISGVFAFIVDRWLNVPVDGGALDNEDSRIFIIDRNMASHGEYKPLKPTPLAKRGSSTEVMLRGVFTLIVSNEKAHYQFAGAA